MSDTGAQTEVLQAQRAQGESHRLRNTLVAAGAGVVALAAVTGWMRDVDGGAKPAGAEEVANGDCEREPGTETVYFADWATGNRMAPPLESTELKDIHTELLDYLALDTAALAVYGVETGVITDVEGVDQFDARIKELNENEEARDRAYKNVCEVLESGTMRFDTLSGEYSTYMMKPKARDDGRPEVAQTRSNKKNTPVVVYEWEKDGKKGDLTLLRICRQPAQQDIYPGLPFVPDTPDTPLIPGDTPETTTTTLRRHTPATGVPPIASQPPHRDTATETPGYPERGHAEHIVDSQEGDPDNLNRTPHGTRVPDSQEGGEAPGGGNESVVSQPGGTAPNNPSYQPGTESNGTNQGTSNDANSGRAETEASDDTSGTGTDPGMPGATR